MRARARARVCVCVCVCVCEPRGAYLLFGEGGAGAEQVVSLHVWLFHDRRGVGSCRVRVDAG